MRYADTQVVTLADAPSDEMDILKPTTFPDGGPRSAKSCPTCNEEQNSIGRHFAQSGCGYPILSQDEASALIGAWVAGAFVNPPKGRGTPRLILRANDPQRLRAVQSYLGVCGRHLFDMTTQDRKQLNTTPHPALEALHDAERGDVRLTRRAAEVIYILRGQQVRDGIAFTNLIDSDALAQLFEDVNLDITEQTDDALHLSDDAAATFDSWTNVDALDRTISYA